MLGVSALAFGAAPIAVQAETVSNAQQFHADHVLGTSLDITTVTDTSASALMAVSAARAEIDRLDALLSTWRADSEISALNNASSLAVSPDLYAVLHACEDWRGKSAGAFDCRLGAVQEEWRLSETRGVAPSKAKLAGLAKASNNDVGFRMEGRVVARPDGVQFAVDGLAKGYVIDAALAAARAAAPNLQGMMIDIGGDMRCYGRSPDGAGWRVGIADPANPADNAAPLATIRVSNMAVAASGRGMRDLTIDGCDYGHTLNPADGQSARQAIRATVVAPRAADADALATAMSVLPPRQGLALAKLYPGVQALLIEANGKTHTTAGWDALTCQIPGGAAWPTDFAMKVDYTVPKINAGNYRAPFVYMWITDANKNVVRTLLLLGNQGRWMQENYLYWRRVGRRDPEKAQAIAVPSRKPGSYSVVWDGKDDAGKMLPQGAYSLNIESAREHGDHSFQSISANLGAGPAAGQAAPVAELGAVKVSYGKVG
jgi:thiamine biosynthesis lipoprotein